MKNLLRRYFYNRWAKVLSAMLIITVIAVFGPFSFFVASSLFTDVLFNDTKLDDFKLSTTNQRVLVVVPHPDDDIIGCYSLIRQAVKMRAPLKVVFLTNGDGEGIDDRIIDIFVPRKSADFINIGYQKQTESRAALGSIGCSSQNILFLGYPDGGLQHLWDSHWAAENPYRSQTTQQTLNPYRNAPSVHAAYAGVSVAHDLETICRDFAPTTIVYPHARDYHPDHYATHDFVKFIITKLQLNVLELTFLVHKEDMPTSLGKNTQQPWLPPKNYLHSGEQWFSTSLTPEEIHQKEIALQFYRTELSNPLMTAYLMSFIRKNGLFSVCQDYRYDDTIFVQVAYPMRNSFLTYFNKNAAIISHAIKIDPERVVIQIQTEKPPTHQTVYKATLIFFDSSDQVQRLSLKVANNQLWIDPLPSNRPGALPAGSSFKIEEHALSIELFRDQLPTFRDVLINFESLEGKVTIDRIGLVRLTENTVSSSAVPMEGRK